MYMPQKKSAKELTALQNLTFEESEDSSNIKKHTAPQDLTFEESKDSSDIEEPPQSMQGFITCEQL